MQYGISDEQAGAIARQPNMEMTYDGLGRRSLRVTTDLVGGHVAHRDPAGWWLFDTAPFLVTSPTRIVAERAFGEVMGTVVHTLDRSRAVTTCCGRTMFELPHTDRVTFYFEDTPATCQLVEVP